MKKLAIIITGGTKGIGLAIAECMARRGAHIAITYHRDNHAAEKAKSNLQKMMTKDQQLLILKGDAGDPDVVAEQYSTIKNKLGTVGILVNNAGIMTKRMLDEISVNDWNETLRVNLSGAFYWCRQVTPEMKRERFGRIVNISSIAARGGGVVGPHYAASKAGLLGLTRYTARECGPFGVTVNAIAPAFIEDAGIFSDWPKEKKAALEATIPIGRIGTVDDVVLAFEYLIDSSYITGVALDVNGGTFMI